MSDLISREVKEDEGFVYSQTPLAILKGSEFQRITLRNQLIDHVYELIISSNR